MVEKRYERMPWMKVDPRDLDRRRLQRLTPAEMGCWIRICKELWMEGEIPDDNDELSEITGAFDQWTELRPTVEALFTVDGGVWRDHAMEESRQRDIDKAERRREVGRIAARARWGSSPEAPNAPEAEADGEEEKKKKRRRRKHCQRIAEAMPTHTGDADAMPMQCESNANASDAGEQWRDGDRGTPTDQINRGNSNDQEATS